ncbi:hypothetical protein BKA62DRAFT_772769 [Auriculariales sp. MPI-PUGE-AT-0066]|nr:hypothetical protein BKA62DRAFT_772769 [Auriculariales sp. MPI-PUGE-AT-0066]
MSEQVASGSPLPSETLHGVFGAMVIGTWLNCIAFALEGTQLYKYFISFSSDRLWTRVLVVVMSAIDLAATCSICALAYNYAVSGWGDVVELQHQNVNFTIFTSTTGCVALLMHIFLIRRYFLLSNNFVVAGLLALPAFAGFVGAMLVTWAVGTQYTESSERYKQRPYLIVWLVGAATADILISCSLIYELSKIKTSFKHTQSLIGRLVRNSIMSGMLPALLAVTALVTFLPIPDRNYSLIFSFPLGRVSTLTVLYTLNQRGKGNGASTNGRNIQMDTGRKHTGAHTETRIGVHQISVVHVEGSPSGQPSEADFETASYAKRGDII